MTCIWLGPLARLIKATKAAEYRHELAGKLGVHLAKIKNYYFIFNIELKCENILL